MLDVLVFRSETTSTETYVFCTTWRVKSVVRQGFQKNEHRAPRYPLSALKGILTMSLFPLFQRFQPPAAAAPDTPPATGQQPPSEAAQGPPLEAAPPAASGSPTADRPADDHHLEATERQNAQYPPPAAAAPSASPAARLESPPGSQPASESTPAAAAVPVHETRRTMLQAFVPVCEACLSSVYLERAYSDGSESLTCVCCRAVVDGEGKPGLAEERRKQRENARNRLSGRFAETEN